MKVSFTCAHCGKVTAGRRPFHGDGTFYFPRRHKDEATGKPCKGNVIEAILESDAGLWSKHTPRSEIGTSTMNEYFIWSNEHKAWWRHSRAGYTKKIEEAGKYSLEEAMKVSKQAGVWNNVPNEAIVPTDVWQAQNAVNEQAAVNKRGSDRHSARVDRYLDKGW